MKELCWAWLSSLDNLSLKKSLRRLLPSLSPPPCLLVVKSVHLPILNPPTWIHAPECDHQLAFNDFLWLSDYTGSCSTLQYVQLASCQTPILSQASMKVGFRVSQTGRCVGLQLGLCGSLYCGASKSKNASAFALLHICIYVGQTVWLQLDSFCYIHQYGDFYDLFILIHLCSFLGNLSSSVLSVFLHFFFPFQPICLH